MTETNKIEDSQKYLKCKQLTSYTVKRYKVTEIPLDFAVKHQKLKGFENIK